MAEGGETGATQSGGLAKAFDAWLMVLFKALILAFCIIVLAKPQWLPRVSQLIDDLGDVDFAGMKIHFDHKTQEELAKHGVVFKDNKLFIGGHEVDDIAENNGKLQSQIDLLTGENQKLAKTVAEQSELLKRAGQPLQNPDGGVVANPALTASVDAAAAVVAQAQRRVEVAKEVAAEVAKPDAPTPVSNSGYAIVFSSDQDDKSATALDHARDKVRRAREIPNTPPITLYRRGPYLASTAEFLSRKEAADALPSFTAKFPVDQPFIVNLSSWCPQPTRVAPAAPPTPEQKSCGF